MPRSPLLHFFCRCPFRFKFVLFYALFPLFLRHTPHQQGKEGSVDVGAEAFPLFTRCHYFNRIVVLIKTTRLQGYPIFRSAKI